MLAAFRLLTVLPLGRRAEPGGRLGSAAAYFPLVGLCLGLVLAGLDLALEPLVAIEARSALLLAALAALSGGLHLDGLIDSFDGLFGGRDAQERLAIMRDSRVGTYGAVAAIVVVLLQYACLADLQGWARLGGMLAAPLLGRWAMVYLAVAFPYARSEGLGWAFKRATTRRDLALCTLFSLAVLAALGPAGPALLPIAWLAAWLFGVCAWWRVRGLTGDLYGAGNELVSAAVLLATTVAQRRGLWLGW